MNERVIGTAPVVAGHRLFVSRSRTVQRGLLHPGPQPSSGVLGRSIGQGTLLGDDEKTTAPILYIGDVSVVCGASGTQFAEFAVVLSSPQSGPVTFSYATQDASAISGTDYTGVSGTGTVLAGQTSVHIEVPILPNPATAATKTFMLNITSPTGATIERATGIGTILNWTAQ